MGKALSAVIIVISLLGLAATISYCEEISIEELVSQYRRATDLQKSQFEKHFMYEKISIAGKVQNVEQWKFFDTGKDEGKRYYKVTTSPRTTTDGIPYEVLIFYKDKGKVGLINKTQEVRMEGALVKIIDQRLIVSVWVYAEELTDFDKQMFSQGL